MRVYSGLKILTFLNYDTATSIGFIFPERTCTTPLPDVTFVHTCPDELVTPPEGKYVALPLIEMNETPTPETLFPSMSFNVASRMLGAVTLYAAMSLTAGLKFLSSGILIGSGEIPIMFVSSVSLSVT